MTPEEEPHSRTRRPGKQTFFIPLWQLSGRPPTPWWLKDFSEVTAKGHQRPCYLRVYTVSKTWQEGNITGTGVIRKASLRWSYAELVEKVFIACARSVSLEYTRYLW